MTLSKTKLKKNETLLKVFLENYNHHRSTEPLPENCREIAADTAGIEPGLQRLSRSIFFCFLKERDNVCRIVIYALLANEGRLRRQRSEP
jgi:hypothetical protein